MRDALSKERRQALSRLARAYGIKIVYLFGSQAELGLEYLDGGDPVLTDPLGDLDIGVVCLNGELSPIERADFYARLSLDIQDLFEPFAMDLVLLEETHSVFQSKAILGKCVYAENQVLQEDYEERVLAKAADFRPVLELFYRERLEERHDRPHPR